MLTTGSDEWQNSVIMLDWHIGNVITKVREMQNIPANQKTRAALARKVGITAYWMGQIERSGKCGTPILERIAAALNTTAGALYDEIPKSFAVDIADEPEDPELFRKLHEIFQLTKRKETVLRAVIDQVHRECLEGK